MATRTQSVTVRVSPSTRKALRTATIHLSELTSAIIMMTDGTKAVKPAR